MHREVREWLVRVGFMHDSHTTVSDLKVGDQQLIEIAKAFSLGAWVLIFDEPTLSLSEV